MTFEERFDLAQDKFEEKLYDQYPNDDEILRIALAGVEDTVDWLKPIIIEMQKAFRSLSSYCDTCDDTHYVYAEPDHEMFDSKEIDCPDCRGLAIETLARLDEFFGGGE